MTKILYLFAKVPKDHPQYEEHEDLQTMALGIAAASALFGFVLGVIVAKVI